MWSSEREVDVMDLQRGMFVARLDRPWEETSFPLQGFLIKSDEDIEKLCLYCERVYVDVYKSRSPHTDRLNAQTLAKDVGDKTKKKENLSAKSAKQLLSRLAIEKYQVTSPFKRELQRATPILRHLEVEINHLMTPGGYLNKATYRQVYNSASDLAESIIRNPDAMVWLSCMQRSNTKVYQHVLRMAIVGCLVGRQLGLNRFLLVDLTMALLMTGIGKSLLGDQVLREYRVDNIPENYRQHLSLTLERLAMCQLPGVSLMDTIANYCERIDGSGYPDGKLGKAIPLLARIAGLIEYFEIQVNPFNRQHAVAPAEAIGQLNLVKGKLFDKVLVEKFVTAIGIYPTGTLVELNDNRTAIVCGQTYTKRLRASIVPLTNRQGDAIDNFKVLDLALPNQWQLHDTGVRIRRGLPINSLPDSLLLLAHNWLFQTNIGHWGKFKNLLSR